MSFQSSTPVHLINIPQVRTISKGDSNTDMFQLSGRLTAAVECENIFGEHPEWSRGPRRLRLPVWQDTAGDVSAKIDHISARSWEGDTRVKNVSIKTTWIDGRGIAEGELAAADWEAPFESMEHAGGFSIYCPITPKKMVLLDAPSPEEREEDDDEGDNRSTDNSTNATPENPASEADILPDFEDLADEAISGLTATKKPYEAYLPIDTAAGAESTPKTQHKSTILRILSGKFSIAESRDRLKRVRGFGRHNEMAGGTDSPHSNDPIPGEPMLATEDPAAILVRSNGFVWLAVVLVAGISSGPNHQIGTLPTRLLTEPNVRIKVQIMELTPSPSSPPTSSDWEWSEKFLKASGSSTIFEVMGSQLQLLNPVVLPSTNASKKGSMSYHFNSAELVTIAAAMELRATGVGHLPEVEFGRTFPYRTAAGELI